MAVHRRIPMTGKMLDAAVYPAVLIGGQSGAAKGGHLLHPVAVAADTDDRVVGIAVDIQHRGHVEVRAQAPKLPDGNLRGPAGILRVPGGRHCHGPGDIHRIPGQAGDHAPLFVDDDKGRYPCLLKDILPDFPAQAAQLRGALHVPPEEDDIADFILPDKALEFLRQPGAVKAVFQLLAQHLGKGHFHMHSLLG